jgi:hypothetical protein
MMESLETLSRFVKKYPQKKKGILQYSFLGGTAIRLYQEKFNDSKDKRIISDFDLLNFYKGSYPVHTISPSLVFGLLDISQEELEGYVEQVSIKDQEFFFMGGSFLAFSKSCAIDNPREKDYTDVNYLYENNHVNFGKLNHLFDISQMINNSRGSTLKNFKWFFKDPSKSKINLYQSFPRFVNLVADFNEIEKAESILVNYSKKDKEKIGYAISSVIYDMHAVIKELSCLKEKDKLHVLRELSSFAVDHDYVDFDRKVHRELVPKARNSKNKKKAVLDSLI